MTNEDAVALLFVSLHALIYRRSCLAGQEGFEMPLGLLEEALAQLENVGIETETVRRMFTENGVDLSQIPGAADFVGNGPQEQDQPFALLDDPEEHANDIEGSGSWRKTAWNRVPIVIAESIRAKFRAGWSKSRIAREFRLNRRTVIRICAAH